MSKMQNIDTILGEFGLEIPADKKEAFRVRFHENYKTVSDYDKLKTDCDGWKERAETAEETLKSFDGADPAEMQKELNDWKEKAKEAEKNAQTQLLQRDQRDYLKAEFDKLGIESPRVRDSLMREIMGEDGLKWKNGAFMGLSDFLSKENEKDHFYQTQEEREAAEAQEHAQQNAARFTTSVGKQVPPGTMSKKDIMAIKDPGERQAKIAENISLFTRG